MSGTVLETIADQVDEGFEIERLENRVADGTGRDFRDAALARGGEDDDVWAAVEPPRPLEELESIDPWHHQIEKDQVVRRVFQQIESGGTIGSEVDLEAQTREHGLEKDTDGEVVIDDENSVTGTIEPLRFHRTHARIGTGDHAGRRILAYFEYGTQPDRRVG